MSDPKGTPQRKKMDLEDGGYSIAAEFFVCNFLGLLSEMKKNAKNSAETKFLNDAVCAIHAASIALTEADVLRKNFNAPRCRICGQHAAMREVKERVLCGNCDVNEIGQLLGWRQ